ncbi:hypothetical protein [Funiculus sociatus]
METYYSVSQLGAIYRGSDVQSMLVGTWQCYIPTDVSHPTLELL